MPPGVYGQPYFGCLHSDRPAVCRNKGGRGEVGGINTQEKMAHGGVAHRGNLVDFIRLNARFSGQFLDNPVERFDHFALQPFKLVRTACGVSDPRNDIGSEDILGIGGCSYGQRFAAAEIVQ